MPRTAGDAEDPGGPAVTDPVVKHTPYFQLPAVICDKGVYSFIGDRSRQQRGIVLMSVPSGKGKRRTEQLGEIGVEAEFRCQIDQFSDVFVAV